MDRQPAAIDIVCLLTEQVKQLCVDQRDHEVEGRVCVAHDEKKSRPFIPDRIQLQFIVSCDLPELFDVKGCQPGTAADQDALSRLCRSQFELPVLADRKVVRIPFFQPFKHQVYDILEVFIVLPDFVGIDEFDHGVEVLFLRRRLIVDIADQSAVKQGLCLGPEWIPLTSFALRVCNQGCHQL